MSKRPKAKKSVAAKKSSGTKAARKPAAKPSAKAAARPAQRKSVTSRTSAVASAPPVESYQPRPIEGVGWKPFRYPPE